MDPPERLREALEEKELSTDDFFTLKHGETKVVGENYGNVDWKLYNFNQILIKIDYCFSKAGYVMHMIQWQLLKVLAFMLYTRSQFIDKLYDHFEKVSESGCLLTALKYWTDHEYGSMIVYRMWSPITHQMFSSIMIHVLYYTLKSKSDHEHD